MNYTLLILLSAFAGIPGDESARHDSALYDLQRSGFTHFHSIPSV